MSLPLSYHDRILAFKLATKGFPKRLVENGAPSQMTDVQLEAALRDYLGILGGQCAPNQLSICYQGAGLKIWAGWQLPNYRRDQPMFQGKATIRMVRETYGIIDPTDAQMSLF